MVGVVMVGLLAVPSLALAALLGHLDRPFAAAGRWWQRLPGRRPLQSYRPSIETLAGLDAGRDLEPGSARLAGLLEGLQGASYTLSEQLGLRFFSHSMLRQTYAT